MSAAAALAVNEVFGPTVQGEGPTAGRRAAFVRLAHCNLNCAWCDTPYSWDWSRFDPGTEVHRRTAEDVLAEVSAMGVDRVVITGGEPLLQQRALLPVVAECRRRGWAVEIETNGTRAPGPDLVGEGPTLNVSIKLAHSGVDARRRLRPAAIRALAACGAAVFKFVAADLGDLEEIGALAARYRLDPVWVMPEGVTADAVVARTRILADPVIARGWQLGTRLHVLAWGNERGR